MLQVEMHTAALITRTVKLLFAVFDLFKSFRLF